MPYLSTTCIKYDVFSFVKGYSCIDMYCVQTGISRWRSVCLTTAGSMQSLEFNVLHNIVAHYKHVPDGRYRLVSVTLIFSG